MISEIVLFTIVCGYLVKYLWNRRKLYLSSWQMNGPLAYPIIGNALLFRDTTEIHSLIRKLAQIYESPVRLWLGQRYVAFVFDPQHIEIIMNAPETAHRGQVSSIMEHSIGGNGIFTSRGEEWKMHRKYLNQTMHYSHLNSFYPIFNKNIKILRNKFEQKISHGAFDVYTLLEACTMDMICGSLMQMEPNVQSNQNLEILNCVNFLMHVVARRMFQPWLQLMPLFRLSKYYKPYIKSQQIAKDFINKGIREFKEKKDTKQIEIDSKKPIFIDYLFKLVNKNIFTYNDILFELQTMLSGGFETTAIAGSYVFLLLAIYPQYQEEIYNELKEIFPKDNDEPVRVEDIARMVVADRFIRETLRLYTIVPVVSRYAENDLKIGDHTIRAGTEIACGIYEMHRSKSIWGPNAETFDPDNFLPEKVAQRHPYAFLPFSGGPRNCIGKKYGYIVLKMFIAWIVRRYHFTTDLKVENLKYQMNITLKLINKHMIYVHRRENRI